VFTEKKVQEVRNTLDGCSTSFIIREIQTKSVLRYHILPVNPADIKTC
jgi:hypothetical protein